jgi:hypothetical protein
LPLFGAAVKGKAEDAINRCRSSALDGSAPTGPHISASAAMMINRFICWDNVTDGDRRILFSNCLILAI